MIANRDRLIEFLFRAVLVIVFGWFAYSGAVDGNLDMVHEGDKLAHYDALRAGKLPFRDIYIFHGFGDEVVKPLLACRWFGESVTALRRLGGNAFHYRGPLPALGMACLALAAAVLIRSRWLLALVLLALSGMLLETTDRHLFAYLALAFAGGYIHTGRRGFLIVAGGSAVWAALYSLDVGLFTITSLGFWSYLQPMSALKSSAIDTDSPATTTPKQPGRFCSTVAPLLIGGALAAAPFVAWCLYHGILLDFINNCLTQLFKAGERSTATYPLPAWPATAPLSGRIGALFGPILLFIVPPILILLTFVLCMTDRKRGTPGGRSIGLLISLFAACFWASVITRPDFWHLAFASGSIALCAACLWERLGERMATLLFRFAFALTLGTMLAAFVTFGQGGLIGRRCVGHEFSLIPASLQRNGKALVTCAVPRVGDARVEETHAQYLAALVSVIQRYTPPGDVWLDLTDQSLLYFLSERGSPTSYYAREHWRHSESMQRQVADEILDRPLLPACVLRFANDDIHTRVDEIVNRYYKLEGRIGRMELLRCVDRTAHLSVR